MFTCSIKILHLRNTTLIYAQIWLSPFQLLKFTTSKVFTTAHTNKEQVERQY